MLSGLNPAVFSVSRLERSVLSVKSDRGAQKLLEINVGVNVLLALLSDSLMAPVAAFFYETFFIFSCIHCAGPVMPPRRGRKFY